MAIDPFDEQWAIRRAFRRFIDPEDARLWAYILVVTFTLGITFLMIVFVLWRIRQEMHITPSMM